MAMRTILALLNGERGDSQIIDAAWALAERHSAHLSCLRFGPAIPTMLDSSVLLPPESGSQSAREHFAAWCARHLPFFAESPLEAPRASLDPAFVIESDADEMAARMRLSDLVVMVRPEGWLADSGAGLHSVLFEAGRPVLLLPPGHKPPLLQSKIVIAWNGSEQAARAVAFAQPLLVGAQAVHVFDRAERNDIRAGRGPAELIEHLQWHGIAAKRVAEYEDAMPIAEDLLRSCHRLDADLVVMGGYNHGRLREFLFGGVTRRILGEAPLPVLMVH